MFVNIILVSYSSRGYAENSLKTGVNAKHNCKRIPIHLPFESEDRRDLALQYRYKNITYLCETLKQISIS